MEDFTRQRKAGDIDFLPRHFTEQKRSEGTGNMAFKKTHLFIFILYIFQYYSVGMG